MINPTPLKTFVLSRSTKEKKARKEEERKRRIKKIQEKSLTCGDMDGIYKIKY
jgi:hypothetical protein